MLCHVDGDTSTQSFESAHYEVRGVRSQIESTNDWLYRYLHIFLVPTGDNNLADVLSTLHIRQRWNYLVKPKFRNRMNRLDVTAF